MVRTTKIGIIGLGAIGSVIASTLSHNSNNKLYYFTRTPKSKIQVSFNSHVKTLPITCSEVSTFKDYLDWIIICLKAHHFKSAHSTFQNLIHQNTKVAIIRNGIELVEDILPYTKASSIVPCIIDCAVQPISDNAYQCFNSPIITSSHSELYKAFKSLFPKQGITFKSTHDFKTATWKKLIESASIGAVQCKYRKPSIIFQNADIRLECIALIKEGISVAKADGAMIEADFENTLLSKIKRYPADKGSSMLTDLLNRRKIELSAKNGAIVKVGKKHSIPTPLHQNICQLLS